MTLNKNGFGVNIAFQGDSMWSRRFWLILCTKGSLMGISAPYFCHGCDLTDFWTSTFLSFPLWKSCFLSDLEGS